MFRVLVGLGVGLLLTGCESPSSTASVMRGLSNLGAQDTPLIERIAAPSSSMRTGAETPPPFGYVGFCRRHPGECDGSITSPSRVTLTDARWRQLQRINSQVNSEVRPVEDSVLYDRPEWWSYPSARGGDCEDFVLLKRRRLIEAGWPADALLIAVVRQRNGEGHAVLLAVTEEGEYVLDNQSRRIVTWEDAPYTWVKRQSRHHPFVWVRVERGRDKAASLLPEAPVPTAPSGTPSGPDIALSLLRPAHTS